MNLLKSKNFKKYMISYLMILIVPFLVSGPVYNKAVSIMREDSIRFTSTNLNSTKDLLEQEFIYIDNNILNLSQKPELRRIINLDNPSEGSSTMYWFFEFFEFLNNNLNFESIHTNDKVYLLLNKNNNKSVFAKRFASFDFNDFYTNYFNYENIDYDQWYEIYFGKYHFRQTLPSQNITVNGNKGEYITLLYTMPVGLGSDFSNKYEGVIAYLFDASELRKMLNNSVAENGGWAYILDENNQIIISTNPELSHQLVKLNVQAEGHTVTKIDGRDMLAVYTKSSYMPWLFVSIFPLYNVTEDLNGFRNISVAILIIALIIGISVSVYLSYKNTQPIHNLLGLFPGQGLNINIYRKNELNQLMETIQGIINDNNYMKNSIVTQYNHLRIIYFEKLLKGELKNQNDLDVARKYLDIEQKGSYYVVMLVRIHSMNQLVNDEISLEQDIYRLALDKTLTDASGSRGYVHILDPNEIAVILVFENNTDYKYHLNNIINEVNHIFMTNFTIMPIISIGNLYDNLLDIHLSMKEATYAADYVMNQNRKDTVIWYQDLGSNNAGYYYTNDFETRIITFTKSGNWSELKPLLGNLYLNTISNKNISDQMKSVLLNDLCATLVKLSMELKTDIDMESIENAISTGNLEQYYNALKAEYKKICTTLSSNKKSRNEKLKKEILKYIQSNFTDPNLCVASLSQKFNLSESYFSQFFKEQTGENFSHYLENLRIKHASSLLLDERLSVDEIAQQSGYNNASTFRRAFKRIMFVSPTEYIQLHK